MPELHQVALWICIAVGVFVVGVMFHMMFDHRRVNRPNVVHFHESTLVEFTWTAVPILILVGVAIPTMTTIW